MSTDSVMQRTWHSSVNKMVHSYQAAEDLFDRVQHTELGLCQEDTESGTEAVAGSTGVQHISFSEIVACLLSAKGHYG